jgi:hypothetical protein
MPVFIDYLQLNLTNSHNSAYLRCNQPRSLFCRIGVENRLHFERRTSHMKKLPHLYKRRDETKFDVLKENNMESLIIVVVFTLTLVAIVALGKGVRGKFGGIEIATQQDSISKSKKNSR